jgi:transcriptional regulator with XRE-family HTH domain
MRESPASLRASLYGARLKAQAEHKGLTARQLAVLMGVTESAVSRWYAGTREMADDHRIAAAKALEVPVLAIFPVMTRDGELVA